MANDAADLKALREVMAGYAATCNAGDLEGWMALWAEDGVQMPNDAPSRVGRRQIREGMKPAFEAMDLSITIGDDLEVDIWGDHAMSRCTYSLALTPKGGGETIDAMPDGKALTLYARQSDGSWKITCDCFNSNREPAPA